jgi:hypothetical protein
VTGAARRRLKHAAGPSKNQASRSKKGSSTMSRIVPPLSPAERRLLEFLTSVKRPQPAMPEVARMPLPAPEVRRAPTSRTPSPEPARRH